MQNAAKRINNNLVFKILITLVFLFIIEAAIMHFVHLISPVSMYWELLIDSSLLVITFSPVLYFMFYKNLALEISQRRQTEEKIKGSENLMRLSQKIAHLGHWVMGMDGEIYWSDETYRIFGLKPQEIDITFETFLDRVQPDDSNLIKKERDALLSSDLYKYKFNYRINRNDGEERILFEQAEVERDKAGKPLRIIGVVQDITKPKKMEQSLRESELRYRSVTQSTNDAIISADSDGNIISWNNGATLIFGHSVDEAMGKPLTLLMPERLRKAHLDGIRRYVKNKKAKVIGKRVELVGLKKDGEEFPMELSLSTWSTESGIFFSGIIHNISKRKIWEEELENSNKELKKTLEDLKDAQNVILRQEKLASIGTLSAGVAHEILNPLNIIGTIAQVMQMEKLTEESKDNLSEVMKQVKRATKIANNLRMFAHTKKGERKEINIHNLFDETALLIEHDLKLNNVLIKRELDDNLPVIEADEDEIVQVFLNFLNNARDALKGRKDNIISVTTKNMKDYIEFRFSDNGPGIPEKILQKIFDPFFTTKDPGEGTGLGLSIVHKIIENHNGTMKVESEEGKGAAFIITLPIKQKS